MKLANGPNDPCAFFPIANKKQTNEIPHHHRHGKEWINDRHVIERDPIVAERYKNLCTVAVEAIDQHVGGPSEKDKTGGSRYADFAVELAQQIAKQGAD